MWTIKAINCLFRLSASLLGNGGRQRCEIFLSLPLFDQSLPSGLKPNHPNLFCVFHSDSAAVTTFWNLVAEAQWTLCLPALPTLTTSYPPPSLHHHLPRRRRPSLALKFSVVAPPLSSLLAAFTLINGVAKSNTIRVSLLLDVENDIKCVSIPSFL